MQEQIDGNLISIQVQRLFWIIYINLYAKKNTAIERWNLGFYFGVSIVYQNST